MDDAPPDYDEPPYDDEPPMRRGGSSGGSGGGGGSTRGRVPPHNLAAEESLLGAMLLSRSAIDIASESTFAVNLDDMLPVRAHIESTTSFSAGAQGGGESRIVMDATYEPAT